jgi:hypothetical protein
VSEVLIETGDRALELTRETDVDLVDRIYELVGQLDDVDDPLANELYFFLTEAFERFAPNVELELTTRSAIDCEGERWEEALAEYVAGCGRRQASRLTARARRAESSADEGEAVRRV